MDYDFSKFIEVDFNGTSVSEVYLDDTLVWSKPKLLDFTFSGSAVTGYTGSGGAVIVPSTYSIITTEDGTEYFIEGTNYEVNSINSDVFMLNDTITSVDMPSITSIATSGFNDCSNLTTINAPLLTQISTSCFWDCTSLMNITLSTNLTTIKSSAFQGCTALTSITIPSTVTYIGDSCFEGCSSLSTVNTSGTLEFIGQYAFAGTNLSSLTSHMRDCSSLGVGCFSFLNAWTIDTQNKTIAQRLVSTSSNENLGLQKVYCGVLLGGTCQKIGGDNTPTGSETIYYTIDGVESSITMSVGQTITISSPMYKVMLRNYVPTIALQRAEYANRQNWDSVSHYLANSAGSFTSGGMDCTAGQITGKYINSAITATCLVEGTLITLADGSHKAVEDLNYNDLLRVWNLETGQFDHQYPLAISKGEEHNSKYRLTIEDGSYLEICGQHDIFDPVAHMFRTYGEGAINSLDEDYYVMKDNGTNLYSSMKIISIDIIHEKVTAYGIITSGIITTFANDMMIGLGVLNLVPITEENKFSEVFETLKQSCYTYDRFTEEIYDDVEKDLAIGMNLLMTDIYHKDASGLPNLVAPFRNRKPLPNYKGKKLHYLALDDGELTTIRSFENELTVLPEIKTPGKTKWYIVGEYKYLEPGDTYITKFSTVIKAV